MEELVILAENREKVNHYPTQRPRVFIPQTMWYRKYGECGSEVSCFDAIGPVGMNGCLVGLTIRYCIWFSLLRFLLFAAATHKF